jgi:hypothetical protein
MRKINENQEGWTLNGTHQHLVRQSIPYRNAYILIPARRVIGLEVNIKETKCMFLSQHQNARQNHNS